MLLVHCLNIPRFIYPLLEGYIVVLNFEIDRLGLHQGFSRRKKKNKKKNIYKSIKDVSQFFKDISSCHDIAEIMQSLALINNQSIISLLEC
jgi:hypothetical protein